MCSAVHCSRSTFSSIIISVFLLLVRFRTGSSPSPPRQAYYHTFLDRIHINIMHTCAINKADWSIITDCLIDWSILFWQRLFVVDSLQRCPTNAITALLDTSTINVELLLELQALLFYYKIIPINTDPDSGSRASSLNVKYILIYMVHSIS